MRRIRDLKLVRNNSPLFTLTWTIIHPIDAESPFYGASPEDLTSRVLFLVVTLTGHDATYGQTTFARTVYEPPDIRVGHRYVDVVSALDDGRTLIDYDRFHDTIPDAGPTAIALGASRPSN